MNKRINSKVSRKGWIAVVVGMALILGHITGALAAENTPSTSPSKPALDIKVGFPAQKHGPHTVAEWMEIVKKEAEEEERTLTEEFKTIRLGAGTCACFYSGDPKDPAKAITPEQSAAIVVFKKFMKDKGEALYDRWSRNEEIAGEDLKYIPLIHQTLFSSLQNRKKELRHYVLDRPFDMWRNYERKVMDNAIAVLKKGMDGTPLTDEDVETLRVGMLKGRVWSEFYYVPGRFQYYGNGMPHRPLEYAQRLGTIIDFRLPYLQTYLRSPQYSDMMDRDAALTRVLRKDGVLLYLNAMAAYESKEEGGVKTYVSKPSRLIPKPGEKAEDYYHLSAHRGKKPIVIYAGNWADFIVYWGYEALEPLYQAYKDKVDFLVVECQLTEAMIYNNEYFHPKKPTVKYCSAALSYEERAQGAKNMCLRIPTNTVPHVLDDPGNTFCNDFFTGGGAQETFLIDTDGRLAYASRATANSVQQFNEVEYRLRELLARGGKTDMAMAAEILTNLKKLKYSKLSDIMEGVEQDTLRRKSWRFLVNKAKVESVDAKAGKIVVKIGDTLRTLTTSKWTGLLRDGVPSDISALKAGEEIEQFDFRNEPYFKGAVQWKHDAPYVGMAKVFHFTIGDKSFDGTVRTTGYQGYFRFELSEIPGSGDIPVCKITIGRNAEGVSIWLCGTVESVDAATHTFQLKPKLDFAAMKGWQFYQKDKERLFLTRDVAERMKCVGKWVQKGDAPRKVLINDGVEVFLNGEFGGKFNDIAAGDAVAIEYLCINEDLSPQVPRMVRISKPIGK